MAASPTPVSRRLTGVDILDSSGALVGSLEYIDTKNAAAITLARLPVRRKVRARSSRAFDHTKFAMIYEMQQTFAVSDAKPSRWAAVMTQAKGDLLPAEKSCTNCVRGRGPWVGCITVRDLPGQGVLKCGNCEWSKQSCIWPSDLSAESGLYTALYGPKTATTTTAPVPSQHASASDADDEEPNPARTQPITPGSLALRHDGRVYTEPKCMRGVPVEKISPTHPYYNESWEKDIITSLKEKQVVFRQRQLEHKDAGEKTKMFMNQRQVNRGDRSIKFLEDGPFHPYQLLAKDYMQSHIVGYDTLFRLAETYRELEGYQENGTCLVTPGDWIRQRLHEVITDFEKSNSVRNPFNLAQAVSGLYGDPKLIALRRLNGKKSVGRPSLGGSAGQPPSNKRRRMMGPAMATAAAEPAEEPHIESAKELHVQSAREPQVESVQERHVETAKGPDAEAIEEPQIETAKQPDTQTIKEPHTEPVKEPDTQTPKEPHIEPVKEPDTRTTKEPNIEPVKEPDTGPTKEPHIEPRKKTPVAPTRDTPARLPDTPAVETPIEAKSVTPVDSRRPGPSVDREAAPAKQRKGKKGGRDPDLAYKGYTDTDEVSGIAIYDIDWALSSVRSRVSASPTSLTQYWHFVEDESEGCMFEHQGYMGDHNLTEDLTWRVYDHPVSFSFLSEDVDEILWAPGTLKVIVHCKDSAHTEKDGKPRGPLIAEFKRERSKRRFVVFCQKKQKLLATKTTA